MNVQTAVTELWLDYYHKLTGKSGVPLYDDRGSLFHWIAEYSRDQQLGILEICYAAGYKAGMQEQASVIEDQITTLERTRAVLAEVMHPVEQVIDPVSWQARHFIEKSMPHLTLLLHVADGLLYDSIPRLTSAVDTALKEIDD